MKRTFLATLVALACSQAFASEFYVVAPLPGKTVSRAGIQVALNPSALPSVRMGSAYSYDFKPLLQVTGDSKYTGYGVKWAVTSGSLPPGVTLNASTGVISGVPTAGGTWPFGISATYMTKAGEQTYQVAVTSLTVTLDAATPPQALVGSAYSFNLNPLLKVSGDPAFNGTGVTWTVVSSTLPAGLHLTSDGYIGGTPTAGGTGTLKARATYQGFQGEQTYQVVTLDITVSLAGTMLPQGTADEPYSYDLRTLLAVTGDSAYKVSDVTWSVASGALPAGLSLDPNTGVINGTPARTATGSTSFDVKATYRTKSGQATFPLTIAVAPAKSRWGVTTLDFGNVSLSGADTLTASLYNDGSLAGAWTSLSNLGSGVTADASACSNVAPNAYCSVTFRFTPTTLGAVSLSGIAPAGATKVGNTLTITGAGVQRVLTLNPAINGKTSWNLDTDGPLVMPGPLGATITPQSSMTFTVKLWGAGGGGGGMDAAATGPGVGGGGAYLSGYYKATKNAPLSVVVGGGGAGGYTSTGPYGGGTGGWQGGGNGGPAGAVGSSGGGGGGGGLTALLRASDNARIACAGGGGGGGGGGNSNNYLNGNGNNFAGGQATSANGYNGPQRGDDGGGPGGGGGGCNGGYTSSYFPYVESSGEGGGAGNSIAPLLDYPSITQPGIGGAPANGQDPLIGGYGRGGNRATAAGVAASPGTAGMAVIY
ncbi:hypothetical protein WJ96_06905 [Burkholderia ubonensis]|uniref:Uncharacterized protein n=1 Tax=Burkholderia ubonensis TaxID=101571 RepID=A0AAW3N2M4_9BURK|nr:putative Ig domain-containing protein [Burkholderia ubonensis]KVP75433.1 hypothetical protein WJ93_08700 [Burkholderia ubonensis]KVP98246.1 hypothetical protein WJ96_06905 [Burkholderia ubonensis]KVZ92943.1 hypothetical protein WL25_18565 [Burkholderia ubonensis]